METIEKSKTSLKFWNNSFDKNRLKTFVCWFLKTYGEKKTIELLEQLKNLGFGYATQAGVSLGIDDLLIPKEKMELLYSSNKMVFKNNSKYKNARITAVEKIQLFIDTWNQTSENLKKEVISNFEKTNIFNPVYMMAFSGARGNISQVRQLVGMRGLMSDPQGNIIDFPIQSNFREGLTLTEYLISTYGARKGIVDTALRTATAGYLTRRLVDVAQHVMISLFDCQTTRGIYLFDMKEGNRTLYSFKNRLIGRVLATDIQLMDHLAPLTLPGITTNPGKVSTGTSGGLTHDWIVRRTASSPGPHESTAELNHLLPCVPKARHATDYPPLRGGLGLGYAQTAGLSEALDPSAAKQLKGKNPTLSDQPFFLGFRNQEISTSLATKIAEKTKKAFVRSPLTCQSSKFVCQLCYGWSLSTNKLVSLGEAVGVIAAQSIGEPGTQLTMRTFHTGGVFSGGLTESVIANYDGWIEYLEPIPGTCIRTVQGKIAFLTKAQSSFVLKKSNNDQSTEISFHKIPGYAILFVRHKQQIFKKQIISQFSSVAQNATNMKTQKGNAEQTVYADLEGEVFLNQIDLLEQKSENFPQDTLWKSYSKAKIWILSGKIYQNFILTHKGLNQFLVQTGDFVQKNSVFQRVSWYNSQTNHIEFLTHFQKFSNKAKKKILTVSTSSTSQPLADKAGEHGGPLEGSQRVNFYPTLRPLGLRASLVRPMQRGQNIYSISITHLKNSFSHLLPLRALRAEGKARKAVTGGLGKAAISFSSVSKTHLAKKKIFRFYSNIYKSPEWKKYKSRKFQILAEGTQKEGNREKHKTFSNNFLRKEKIQNIIYNKSKFHFHQKLNSMFLAKNSQLYQKNKWFKFLFQFKMIQTKLPYTFKPSIPVQLVDFKPRLNVKNLLLKVPYIYQYNSRFRSNLKKKYNRINSHSIGANKKLSQKFKNLKLFMNFSNQQKFIPNFFQKISFQYKTQQKRICFRNSQIHLFEKNSKALQGNSLPIYASSRAAFVPFTTHSQPLAHKKQALAMPAQFGSNAGSPTRLIHEYSTSKIETVDGIQIIFQSTNSVKMFKFSSFLTNSNCIYRENLKRFPGLRALPSQAKPANARNATRGRLERKAILEGLGCSQFDRGKNRSANGIKATLPLKGLGLGKGSTGTSCQCSPTLSPQRGVRHSGRLSAKQLPLGSKHALDPTDTALAIDRQIVGWGKFDPHLRALDSPKKEGSSKILNQKHLTQFDKSSEFHLKNSSEKFLKIPILFLPLSQVSFQSLSYVFHLKRNDRRISFSAVASPYSCARQKLLPLQNDKILSYLPLHSKKIKKSPKTQFKLNKMSSNPRSVLQWFCSDSKTKPGLYMISKKCKKWNLKNDYWIQKKRAHFLNKKIAVTTFQPKEFSGLSPGGNRALHQSLIELPSPAKRPLTPKGGLVNEALSPSSGGLGLAKGWIVRKTASSPGPLALPPKGSTLSGFCGTPCTQPNVGNSMQSAMPNKRRHALSKIVAEQWQRNGRGANGKLQQKAKLFAIRRNQGFFNFPSLQPNQTFQITKSRSVNKFANSMTKKQNLNKFSVSTQILQSIVHKNYRFYRIQKMSSHSNSLDNTKYMSTLFPTKQTSSKFLMYLVNAQGKKKVFHSKFSGFLNFSEKSFPSFHFKYLGLGNAPDHSPVMASRLGGAYFTDRALIRRSLSVLLSSPLPLPPSGGLEADLTPPVGGGKRSPSAVTGGVHLAHAQSSMVSPTLHKENKQLLSIKTNKRFSILQNFSKTLQKNSQLHSQKINKRGQNMFLMPCLPRISHNTTKNQLKNTNSFILNSELKNFLVKNLKNKLNKKMDCSPWHRHAKGWGCFAGITTQNLNGNSSSNSLEEIFLAQTKIKQFFSCLPYLKKISHLSNKTKMDSSRKQMFSTPIQEKLKYTQQSLDSTVHFLGKKNYSFYSTKLDISMKPGWVYVFTNLNRSESKTHRLFQCDQIFLDSGKKCIDHINFEQNSVYIENCYAEQQSKDVIKNNLKDLILTQQVIQSKTQISYKKQKELLSPNPFSAFGLLKVHRLAPVGRFLPSRREGRQSKPSAHSCNPSMQSKHMATQNKSRQIFRVENQTILKNKKVRYLVHKSEIQNPIQKISLLIRPVLSKILPNSFLYKNLIYEANKTWTHMQSSVELIKDYHSNLFNKQVCSPRFFSSFASFDFKISKIPLSSTQKKVFWLNYQKKTSNLLLVTSDSMDMHPKGCTCMKCSNANLGLASGARSATNGRLAGLGEALEPVVPFYSKKFSHIYGFSPMVVKNKLKKNIRQTQSQLGFTKKNVSNVCFKPLKNLIKKYLMLNALYLEKLHTSSFSVCLTPSSTQFSGVPSTVKDKKLTASVSLRAVSNPPMGGQATLMPPSAPQKGIKRASGSPIDQFKPFFKDQTKQLKLKFETKYFIKKNFLKSNHMNAIYSKFFSTSFQLKNARTGADQNFYSSFPISTIQMNSKHQNLTQNKFLNNSAVFPVERSNCTLKAFLNQSIPKSQISQKLVKNFLIQNIYSLPSLKWSLFKKVAYLGNQRLFYSYNSEENQIFEKNFVVSNYTKKLKKPSFSFKNSFLFYEFNFVLKNQVFATTDILSPFVGEFVKPLPSSNLSTVASLLKAPSSDWAKPLAPQQGCFAAEGGQKKKPNSWWNNGHLTGSQKDGNQKNHQIFLTKKDMFSISIPRLELFSVFFSTPSFLSHGYGLKFSGNVLGSQKDKNRMLSRRGPFSSFFFKHRFKTLKSQRRAEDGIQPKILQLNLDENGYLLSFFNSNLRFSPQLNNYEKSQKQEKYNESLQKLFSSTRSISNNLIEKNKSLEEFQIKKFLTKYQKRLYKLKGLFIGKPNKCVKLCLGNFVLKGDLLNLSTSFHQTGQIIHLNSKKMTLRYAQCFLVSANGILHVHQADPIFQNAPIFTLPFDTFTTGDIVQGIPKVEQYLEARTTQNGRPFLYSLSILLQGIFKRYCTKFTLQQAVSQSFLKIQLIIVDGVQRVYRSQGVSIADKHLEVIVKQMTSKVQIIHGGQTGFFPGELVELEVIEQINPFLMIPIQYEPVVLGITRASLEVESFLSAASFQQTTKILAKASLYKKKDFLKGLKENILIGNLIPAGTGYMNVI